jgi:hypothetical protein
MAKIYYRRILAGAMTIEDVPVRWRDEVQALLNGETQY